MRIAFAVTVGGGLRHAMQAQQTQPFDEIVAIGRDRPALTASQILCRVKAKTCRLGFCFAAIFAR